MEKFSVDKAFEEAKENRLNPKSLRTFSNYVNKLVELEYLKVERSKSRGMSGSSKLVKKLQNL